MTDMTKDTGKDGALDPEAIVKAARDNMALAADADFENREASLDDLMHVAGRQWDPKERQDREDAGRPCVTVNLLAQHVRQVTGDIRRLNPAVTVLPADSDASSEVADVIEGLVRHIEQASDAASVYEGAAESAAQCSMGNFRILTEYETDEGFEQCIRIERIYNPFAVFWDPAARKETRSDARWVLIAEDMPEDEFRRLYRDASVVDIEADGLLEHIQNWRGTKTVRVAEYFWKEPRPVTLSLMPDGRVVEGKQKGAVRTRTADKHVVMWAKVSGKEVLEGPQEFPSRYLPVIAVTGEELHLGEEVVRSSVIRYAKDPQRVYNYAVNTNIEVTVLQPKAPYVGTVKQFAGLENWWDRAGDENLTRLPYNPDEKAPGPPQRQMPPQPSPGHLALLQQAAADIKGSTGIYDAGLGNRSNESSGVAIRQRQMESDISNSIYTDNLAKAISHCGRVIVDMIPRIYDTPRTVRILGKDDVEKMVRVNEPEVDPNGQQLQVPLNLTVGRYDVRVTVGPNYSTKRQAAAEGMGQLLQSNPAIAPVIGDLWVKAQDWPDADAIAERLKRMVPPEVLGPEDMSPEEQQAAAQQAQMAQAQQAQAEQMQQMQMQMAMQAQQAEMRKTLAEASEKEARAAVAGVEAQAALMEAQNADAADPRMVMLEMQNLAAKMAETLARAGLLQAQTEKTRAETAQTGTETALAVAGALMPPVVAGPPMRAPEQPGM